MKMPTQFSLWMRTHLKDASCGLITQDIDFIVYTEKYYCVVEEKIFDKPTGPAQTVIYKLINDILKDDLMFNGCHKIFVRKPEESLIFLDDNRDVKLRAFIEYPKICYLNQEFKKPWFEVSLYNQLHILWDGKGNPRKHKTRREQTFKRKSKLEPLLDRYKISYTSVDWIFVNYVTGYFCLLFENEDYKNNRIIMNMIDCFERYNSSGKEVKNPKSDVTYRFLGAHCVKHSDDFSSFLIDGHLYNQTDAISILNLDDDKIIKM